MTYNVFGGTLSLYISTTVSLLQWYTSRTRWLALFCCGFMCSLNYLISMYWNIVEYLLVDNPIVLSVMCSVIRVVCVF